MDYTKAVNVANRLIPNSLYASNRDIENLKKIVKKYGVTLKTIINSVRRRRDKEGLKMPSNNELGFDY